MKKIATYREVFENKSLDLLAGKNVLVGGCFDIFHYGHLVFLKKAKKLAQFLVVALEGDEFISTIKKRPPVHTQTQRAEILSAIESIDFVILLPFLNGYEDYLKLVKQVRPKVIAVTEGDPRLSEKQKQAKEIRAEIAEIPLVKGFSTSLIIGK